MSKTLRERCFEPSESLLNNERYRLIDRGGSVLGVAHCDSVTVGMNHFVCQSGVVWCTRLDDRLGVYLLLDVLPKMGVICDVLLTDDEEVGQSTAQEFQTEKKYNWMFQFDRRGTDCVTYDFDGIEPLVKKHFTLGTGSFSDICWLDHLGCAGMNVGTGYYGEHTKRSRAKLKETGAQVRRFKAFYEEFKDTPVPHIPKPKPVLTWPPISPWYCQTGQNNNDSAHTWYNPEPTVARTDPYHLDRMSSRKLLKFYQLATSEGFRGITHFMDHHGYDDPHEALRNLKAQIRYWRAFDRGPNHHNARKGGK